MASKPLVLKLKLAGGVGSVIPKGIIETLLIEAIDGAATYKFIDPQTTKAFASHGHNIKNCRYIERIGKTVCEYPGETKEAIMKSINDSLGALAKPKGEQNVG